MSREIRRVPLNWKHPVEYNPYWRPQSEPFLGKVRPASRLRGQTERFVGLFDDLAGSLADWREELADLRNRTGHSWTFQVAYHLTGYKGHNDTEVTIHPFWTWDGDTEVGVTVRDEDHLHELLIAQKLTEEPDPADYMPTFDVPESELGWCLYETVSEGTPTTPVFATAEELIDHLCTVGQDYTQEPMRRASAEALVRNGHSFGSMIVTGGVLYQSDVDADALEALRGAS